MFIVAFIIAIDLDLRIISENVICNCFEINFKIINKVSEDMCFVNFKVEF